MAETAPAKDRGKVHSPQIVPGSIKRNAVSGGIEFRIRCCGELERSVHIQSLAAYETDEQRKQVVQQFLDEHADRHAAELATEAFLKGYSAEEGCGCK